MPFHHATLSNGLQVIAELNPAAHSVAAGFFVKTGSRDESPELAGVSHFLEHMVFKGTPHRDALAVNRNLDQIGAKHNAQTSEEDTIYYVACLPEYLPAAFDILADILRPSLRQEDFETEKQVILEEIHMYRDNPMMVAYEAARALHFGPHPLGKSVLGTIESITNLTAPQMSDYFAARYGPANVVLALAGHADWNAILHLAEKHCGNWTGPPAPREITPARGACKFETILRAEDTQQTVLAVADAPGLESPDRYAAALLANLLGDQTGSRLYWALIDTGYADGVDVSYQDYNGSGCFYTFLSCDPDEAQANLARITDVFRAVQTEGVTPAELDQAKNKVLARAVLRSERPMGRLMPLGYHWLYRQTYMTVDQEIDAYSRVQIDDVRRVLSAFPLLPMTTVSVGPTTDLKPPE